MSKASDAANAVVNAVCQVFDLYGVRYTREQSRTFMVEGAAGRFRPMFVGRWTDDDGNTHASGRADILARPRVPMYKACASCGGELAACGYTEDEPRISLPLWIECKSGKGVLSHDQRAFRKWVEDNGDAWLLVHDDVTPLLNWLKAHGVEKEPRQVIHAEKLDVSQLDSLPCKFCQRPKSQHQGSIFACDPREAMGKVWRPNVKVVRANA